MNPASETGSLPPMAEDAVFLSYAWGVGEDLVDRLYESLVKDGFTVERDKKSVEYKGSISDFMNRLSDGGAVVIVLSDKYLKSVYCMQELYEIWHRHKDFKDRIFPFVLPDLRIQNAVRLRRVLAAGEEGAQRGHGSRRL